ncbi:hypothetical protein H0H87_007691 [Tephrocybe sp. NHM501043]|nr:hypothetical protein H0H87_007691 [Tephrocybe sp. NHM501043]
MELWPSMLVTTAIVAIYLFTFVAVIKTNELSSVPGFNHQRQLGLNVSEAWQDLHVIAARPHPYCSHANDLVHAYLLARLKPLAATYPHVHVVDDRVSNASYEQKYFEGTNILVKVDGTNEDLHGAVLISAHYDSVSTSNGATDNGMAVVSMMQLVTKLAKTRSKRTAIFNFNNGEEDGLNGAHMFLQHPWSNLTETFLNLEGAAAGSRPILFRSTSTKPLSAFHHKHVPHPHGTILAADAFAARIIRSGTDYPVYAEGGGMEGSDLAYYRGRSYYHTKFDAIPFVRGSTRSLWSMMETIDSAGRALLDQDHSETSGAVVYFDCKSLVVFSYLILLATTIFLPIGGTYLFTALATSAFLGWFVGAVTNVGNQQKIRSHSEISVGQGHQEDAEPTESTPLINRHSMDTYGVKRRTTVWFIQLFVVVPVPVILFSHIGVLLVGAMPQGIVDGGPVWFGKTYLLMPASSTNHCFVVYAALSLIATFLVIPVAPFISSYPQAPPLSLTAPLQYTNSPKTLFHVLLITFATAVAYTSGVLGFLLSPTSLPITRLGFPFSIDAPMKVFFQQQVELITPWVTGDSGSPDDVKTRPRTYLTGVPHYLEQMVVPSLPSAYNSRTECVKDDDRLGLIRCGWPSGEDMLPFPGRSAHTSSEKRIERDPSAQVLSANPWLKSSIHRSSENTTRIWLHGTNTRACRVYFDNAKVARWSVIGGTPGVQKGYENFETVKGKGLTELRFWSRTWDREFVLDIAFLGTPHKVKGRVACEWAEYESGRVGLNDINAVGSTIPAYEEALRFFPRWAALTKLQDGLVEVWSAFEM